MLDEADLHREAAATGFRPEALEKVVHLVELLEGLRSHPFLKTRIALKGGTALNLFVFDMPRLSVDIDLNYIGGAEREVLLAERPKLEQAIEAVCGRLGIRVHRMPTDHAGGKWRLSHNNPSGRSVHLELDVNFMFRAPLWPIHIADSKCIGSIEAKQIPILDPHELAAGKLAALFGRAACRDLFDVRHLLESSALDTGKLRIAFVVYGGINRRDWRTASLADVQADPIRVNRELVPLLRAAAIPPHEQIVPWTELLVKDCRRLLSAILPMKPNETEFLDRLNDRGEIVPELLTRKKELQAVIRTHPGLRWKAANVLKYRGFEVVDEA